jgi:serine/threonine-protein kinase
VWLKILRTLLVLAYGSALVLLFGVVSYLSFNRFVRRGVTPVPDLVGLTLTESETLLADQGLRVRWHEEEDRYDDAVPAEHVVQHEPPAGSLVKKNATIDVIMSLGRRLVEVPEVTDEALQAAQVTLASAGLVVGRHVSIFSDRGVPGTVVGQSPAAGVMVDRATPVDLLVSQDNSSEVYVMPDLIYLDDETVRRFFQRRGFRLGSVKYEPYEGIEAGVVLRQYPLAGHPLRRHDVISLVVAAPAEGEPRQAAPRLGG